MEYSSGGVSRSPHSGEPSTGVLGRRAFLAALSAGSVAALVASIESARARSHAEAGKAVHELSGRVPFTPRDITRVPPGRLVSILPGRGQNIALTVDDGTSSAVVGAYLDFVRAGDVRLTFFPNGSNAAWTEHARTLRPLIESGQVQIGNHTWSHRNLTRLSDAEIADEISRNESFFNKTYGASGRPFLRPPYGLHDERVDRIAAELGYPTITMWWGSLGDSGALPPDQIVANARAWFRAQRIVIGHANHVGVTRVFDELLALLRERNLQTVTLNDVFGHM